jgi:hypothetical protein
MYRKICVYLILLIPVSQSYGLAPKDYDDPIFKIFEVATKVEYVAAKVMFDDPGTHDLLMKQAKSLHKLAIQLSQSNKVADLLTELTENHGGLHPHKEVFDTFFDAHKGIKNAQEQVSGYYSETQEIENDPVADEQELELYWLQRSLVSDNEFSLQLNEPKNIVDFVQFSSKETTSLITMIGTGAVSGAAVGQELANTTGIEWLTVTGMVVGGVTGGLGWLGGSRLLKYIGRYLTRKKEKKEIDEIASECQKAYLYKPGEAVTASDDDVGVEMEELGEVGRIPDGVKEIIRKRMKDKKKRDKRLKEVAARTKQQREQGKINHMAVEKVPFILNRAVGMIDE